MVISIEIPSLSLSEFIKTIRKIDKSNFIYLRSQAHTQFIVNARELDNEHDLLLSHTGYVVDGV